MRDRNQALQGVEKDAESKRHLEGLEADSQRLTEVLRKSASRPAQRNPSSAGRGDASGEGEAASNSGYVRPVGAGLRLRLGHDGDECTPA